MKLFKDFARIIDGHYGRAAKDAAIHLVDFVGYRILQRLWPLLWVLALFYRVVALRNVKIVVVIGSLGKTTTKRFIEHVLPNYRYGQSRRNANAGVAKNLLYARPWDKYWVMEVGIAEKGTMKWHGRMIRPNIVVFTSVGSDHVQNFRGMDEIAEEKAIMLDYLSKDGVVIYSDDDDRIAKQIADRPNETISFGFASSCTVGAENLDIQPSFSTQFDLRIGDVAHATQVIPTLGRASVYAALAAISVGVAEGIAAGPVLDRLSTATAAPSRMEVLALASNSHVVCDDFKATTDSVDYAIRTIAPLDRYRRIFVCGQVEDIAVPYAVAYASIGRKIPDAFDYVILIGHKDLEDLRDEAIRAGMPAENIVHVGPDITAAMPVLTRLIVADSVVLLKGASWQRLKRIGLSLSGRPVRCSRRQCYQYLRPPCGACRLLQ